MLRPKTIGQHIKYWPLILASGLFFYGFLNVIYFQILGGEAALPGYIAFIVLVSTGGFSFLLFGFAMKVINDSKAVNDSKNKRVIAKLHQISDMPVPEHFSHIKFDISDSILKLGSHFSVRLKGTNHVSSDAHPLVLWLCCLETTSIASGGDAGYLKQSYIYEKKYTIDKKQLSGRKIDLSIPTNCPVSNIKSQINMTQWFLRLETLNKKSKFSHFADGIDSEEINIIAELENGEEFPPIPPCMPDVINSKIKIEFDSPVSDNNKYVTIAVGQEITGHLLIIPSKKMSSKKYTLELCYSLYGNDYEIEQKHHIRAPRLKAGENYDHSFSFNIPAKGPISLRNNNQMLKICWCVRVRTWSDWLFDMTNTKTNFVVVPLGVSVDSSTGH